MYRSETSGEASVQLHRAHCDGHPVRAQQEAHPLGDIPVPTGTNVRSLAIVLMHMLGPSLGGGGVVESFSNSMNITIMLPITKEKIRSKYLVL